MLYDYSGHVDSGVARTQYPFVTFTGKTVLVAVDDVCQEVNVVPANLDAFVNRNNIIKTPQRAYFGDWEGGFYKEKLVVIPL